MDEYLPHVLDEYLPHVSERVLSMRRILAPCFGEGIRLTDEYLPHEWEMVFVHGRIYEYLPLVVERVFVSRRRIVWSTPCEYNCGDVWCHIIHKIPLPEVAKGVEQERNEKHPA